MKKYLLFFLISLTGLVSCDDYDDAELREMIKDHEERISKLETLCSQMNTNIGSLETMLKALQKNDYVTSVIPVQQDGKIIGYTIAFSKSAPITIYHGKDGQNGLDGSTPQIGVKQDEDGKYYWTLNGEWIVCDGMKLPVVGENGADGKNGVTPRFEIRDDFWYVSYDDGTSWMKLEKATGDNGLDGESVFSSVSQDDSFVYFVLKDGTKITLPKYDAQFIQFEDLSAKALCVKYWDVNGDNEISYSEVENVTQIGGDPFYVYNNEMIQSFSELKYFKNLKSISSFSGCVNLWKIEFPENLQKISATCFEGSQSLVNISLPSKLKYLGDKAFARCSSLKTIMVDCDSLKVEGAPFMGVGKTLVVNSDVPATLCKDSSIDSICFGSSVKVIGNEAFSGCRKLKEIRIPDFITQIGSSAFAYCDAKTIHIGKNVNTISDAAFYNNRTDYYTVYCESITPPTIGGSVFDYSSFNNMTNQTYYGINVGTIYVPMESVELYKEKWSKYASNIRGYSF